MMVFKHIIEPLETRVKPSRCSPVAGGCTLGGAREAHMPGQGQEAVVGLDNGGRAINATVLDSAGRFLVDRLV